MLPKIEEIEEVAKSVIEKNGHHSPQLIFELDNKINCVLLEYDDETKEEMFDKMRFFINSKKIKTYYLIMEGFKGTNINIRPSKDPEREDVLVINQFNSDLTTTGIMITFSKDKDNNIIWKERDVFKRNDEYKTPWNFYLENFDMAEFIKSKGE